MGFGKLFETLEDCEFIYAQVHDQRDNLNLKWKY